MGKDKAKKKDKTGNGAAPAAAEGAANPSAALSSVAPQVFPLSPHGIIDHLKLRQPGYLKTAAYGHFGRPEFTWEREDATEELLAKAKNS